MDDFITKLPEDPIVTYGTAVQVPNLFPTFPADYRLAVVGEAPGKDEEAMSTPFVGASGDLLNALLRTCGVRRDAVFIGNVCKYRPPKNKIAIWGHKDARVREGLEELKEDLTRFQPNCTLALGNTALWGLLGEPYGCLDNWKIGDFAGSIEESPFGKVVPAFHPAAILRSYVEWPILLTHIHKAVVESRTRDLIRPERSFDLDLSPDEICYKLDNWTPGVQAAIDIEGGLDGWTCISVASSPGYAFIVSFGGLSEEEQAKLYVSLSRFLYRLDIPKVLQNALYDRFVLYYGFNMLIRNVAEDTLIKAAELFPELPKALDTQAFLWTREPAWKNLIAYSKKEQARRAKLGVNPGTEIRNKHRACCIDSAVTLEVSQKQDKALEKRPGDVVHYHIQMALTAPMLYMEKRGIKYNKEKAGEKLAVTMGELNDSHARLEAIAGYSLLGAKGSVSDDKVKKLLYQEKGYPTQYKGRGEEKKVCTDVGALLKLGKQRPNDPLLKELLLASKLDSRRKTLELSTDPDGRMRASYSPCGTETMRTNCKTSPTGSGGNLQTVTKKLRELYLADLAETSLWGEDMWMAQMDLSGADGWTVAARCLQFEDPTMYEDYMYGLKPAKILALMFTYGAQKVLTCSREELKVWCKEESKKGGCCDQDSWLYFACKRVQHASNYGTKARTGVGQIMEDSYKISGTPYYMPEADFEILQRYYFMRYPGVLRWHEWARGQVFQGKNLTSASGHTRIFFGRRKEWNPKTRIREACPDTWREFLADEPQENTTYATNLAMLRLWTDPENRIIRPNRRGKLVPYLVIEPLHQVHDALVVQFPRSRTEWAIKKIQGWFRNPLDIAGKEILIPFEGAYGPSWGELPKRDEAGNILEGGVFGLN